MKRIKSILTVVLLLALCSQTLYVPAASVGTGNTYLDGYRCKYALTGKNVTMSKKNTPVGQHGALSVKGTNLVDEKGKKFQLRGISTHGMHWGEMTGYVNKAAFASLRDEWGANCIRLVSYVTQGGYTQGSKELLDETIQKGVNYASDLGMYAIIDWHVHAENPNDTVADAKKFFKKYAKKYANQKNVIYEICNEPLNTPWPSIKNYAGKIVKVIRKYDKDAIIIVGTNTWSQDVDEVATNGGKLSGKNIMYSFHFYAGTHGQWLRDKVQRALDAKVPVICTEFGICDASGNGNINVAEANRWIQFMDKKNISYSCWSLCNKDESASMISPACQKLSKWKKNDLGATGAWIVNTYRPRAIMAGQYNSTLSLSVKKGKRTKLSKVLFGVSASKIKSYRSSSKSMLAVSSKGYVRGKKKGNAKVTVTLKNGNKIKVAVKVK